MTFKDVEGWFAYESFYKHIAENFLKDSMTIVEVGAFKGKSSIFLAERIKERNLNIKFFVVDHWKGSLEHKDRPDLDTLYDTFQNNVKECGVENFITPIREDSVSASKRFPNESLDFVLIDASHDYDSVKQDISAWLPKIKKGGIFSGDDYDPYWAGVVKAVDELLGAAVHKDKKPAWYVNVS